MYMNQIKNDFAGNALLILINQNLLNLIKKVFLLIFYFLKYFIRIYFKLINIKNKIMVRKKNIICKKLKWKFLKLKIMLIKLQK